MKRVVYLLLALAVFLSGCGSQKTDGAGLSAAQATVSAETETETATQPVTEPETEPTTEPTEPPEYRNPLNGELLDAPYTGRIFAHTITNTQDALPHVNAVKADILVEAYVSRGVVRCLGLYTNIGEVEAIGGTRSTRLLFNQIAQLYDAVLVHGGGFDMVLEDADAKNLDHFNVDSLYRQPDPLAQKVAYRDKQYRRYAPNDLFGYGPGIVEYVEAQGVRVTQPEDKEYFLSFVEDAELGYGEYADEITIYYGRNTKNTVMKYNPDTGKYEYNQYGKLMTDQITGEVEAFSNVLILAGDIYENYIYSECNFQSGGVGYYACGGRIVPIVWECEDGTSPIHITDLSGNPVIMRVGNTYMGILSYQEFDKTQWITVTPPETEPPATPETVTETTAETVPETAAEASEEPAAAATAP